MSALNDDHTVSSSSWHRGKVLGRGCFGTVNLAVNRSDGTIFAVKSVDRSTCLPCQLQSLENEIRILRSVSSSLHVVRFLGDDVTREGTTTFRNLHLEYMPRGSLADVAGDYLDEQLIRLFTRCLVTALRHAHTLGIVHCDIKARNVLLGVEPGSVKLADFGSATEIKPGGRNGFRSQVLPRGSPLWMAPEVIRREYQGPESDVWSLGCTVIEMVTGKPPWRDCGVDALKIIGFSGELPSFPTRLSEIGRDFLDKCLRRDPSERWDCDQLLHHPFLSWYTFSAMSEPSPRRVLDLVFEEDGESESATESNSNLEMSESAARWRMGRLATSRGAIWASESDGWLAVRGSNHGTRHPSSGSWIPYMAGPSPTWLSTRVEMELYEK
ncbi:PREDICTED: mitogen-activated protein kinase kinase kinase A-like [Tarenaya hassleriana]|uniref:mitogen-activated protein kinase kinase kinase A-like n=1 Tax=Tarenaya hassleriana TaxID=28532 RepID=UPI00053C928B|nr:PREDICTED: mitogen-activated protein kinase kinase kinase A-like [Tarenaya hassleriana]